MVASCIPEIGNVEIVLYKMQDLHSKKIHIDLNNLCSNLRLWENVSSFHPNNQDEIRKVYLQRDSCQPLGHVSLKKK